MHGKSVYRKLLCIALICGLWVGYMLKTYWGMDLVWLVAAGGIAGGLIYIAGIYTWRLIQGTWFSFIHWLDNTSIENLLGGVAGLLIGVIIALLSSYTLTLIKGVGVYLAIICLLVCAVLGLQIGVRRALDVWRLLPTGNSEAKANRAGEAESDYKVLDTSAIIDGRIYDVYQSRFLEGMLIVPVFVIEELQHIADSSDNLRRNKGRRGLELLSKMQKDPHINIQVLEEPIPEEREVDMKLIRLCKQIPASIITNDYNLNKVAELQGIKVLNINELTNAVKVVVYPGETMYINILKEGKEPGQGVGYLEDGTMVVVEDAQNELGNSLEVQVTSVFQTAAGRMIFSRRLKEERSLILKPSLPEVPMQEVNMYG